MTGKGVCLTAALIAGWLLIPGFAVAQSRAATAVASRLSSSTVASALPPSNSVSHLAVSPGFLWMGTGKGLARSSDGGRSWQSFAGTPGFPSPAVYSVGNHGDTVWVATGYTKDVNDQSVQTGSGYAYTWDNGTIWHSASQPLDARDDSMVVYGRNRVHFLPIVVPEQNVTFDLAVTGDAVWVASWSSGLRRSTNNGATWERTVLPSRGRSSISPSDSLGSYVIDPRQDNNFLVFSVLVENDSTIWAGSAGGINRSTDGGKSWMSFTSSNQVEHILGDWVIALGAQVLPGRTRIWATNWPAEGEAQEYCVSISEDMGRTWRNALRGTKAYGFAFRDSIAYVATDDGLYRSPDGGMSWERTGSIADARTGSRIAPGAFYAAAVLGDTVYAGTSDGLVATIDNSTHPFGQEWVVFRTFESTTSRGTTYAYPNPFSPRFEVSRVHYTTGSSSADVSLEVFDFGMNRIRTVINNASRGATTEYDEIWDGRNDAGAQVPNGVYFYRLTFNGGEPAWGKIMVLQ